MMNPDNNYNSQLEKTQSQYQRKLARQRQLEAMEAAASGTAPSMQLDISGPGAVEPSPSSAGTAGLRSRNSETARRFLYDDDEDLDAPRTTTTAATSQAGIAARTLFERRDEEDPNALNLMDHETGVYRERLTFGERLTNFFYGGGSMNAMQPEKDAIMTEDGYYSRRDDRGRRVNCCAAACYELKSDKRKTSLLFVLIAIILVCVFVVMSSIPSGAPEEEINTGATIVDPGTSTGGMAVNIDDIRPEDSQTENGVFGKLKNKFGFAGSEEKLRKENTVRFNEILDLLLHEGSTSVSSFLNYEGPEYMALRWVSYMDEARIDPLKEPDAIVQRYILAVFYYNSYITFQKNFGEQKSIGDLNDPQEQFIGVPNPGWTRKDYWLTEKGVCLWYGVKCELSLVDGVEERHYDANNNVTRIEMPNNNVYGYLPSEFKGLEHMTTLDLSDNHLTGTFPTRMGRLYKLEFIYLHHNQIEGTIPPDIGHLDGIRDLYMGHNKLNGTLPTEMGRLVQLQSLAVENNQLTGEVPDLKLSKNLANLILSYNQFSGFFPFQLSLMTNLFQLHLDNNAFTGTIQPELANVRRLQSLRLDHNQLENVIPPFLFKQMSDLREIFLDNNAFTGSIPSTLGHLTHLHTFSVHHNNLHKGIPTEIGGMVSMQKFHVHNNALTSLIPTEVGNLYNLQEFWAMENKLEGGIPTEFGKLRHLKTLYLEKNTLAKEVPSEIANIPSLTTFRLYGNFIKGTMPDEICKLHDNQYSALKFLSADCYESSHKIACDCCDKCY